MSHRAALLAMAVATCASCGPIDERNEIVVAISTTLKPGTGKDFDQLRVEVFFNGERVDKKDFEDLGQPGLTTFPGTFRIEVSDDKLDQLYLFRVTARRSGEDEDAVVQEVLTKFPKDRTALLWMPIEWTCRGSGNHVAEEDYTHGTCPEGERCVAGACVVWDIASADLPDFSEEAVFGNGGCFDTFVCLEGATVVPLPAGSDCVVDLPQGMDAVNVALVTSERGICTETGDEHCLVPLDEESLDAFGASGFEIGADGKIRLAPGICQPGCPMRSFVGGQVLGVAIADASSCGPKKRNVPLCGPWSTAGTDWQASSDGFGGAAQGGSGSGGSCE